MEKILYLQVNSTRFSKWLNKRYKVNPVFTYFSSQRDLQKQPKLVSDVTPIDLLTKILRHPCSLRHSNAGSSAGTTRAGRRGSGTECSRNDTMRLRNTTTSTNQTTSRRSTNLVTWLEVNCMLVCYLVPEIYQHRASLLSKSIVLIFFEFMTDSY